jgi:hypothetical protein
MAHAYVIEGNAEDVVLLAREFAAQSLSITKGNSPDIQVYTFGHFSVEDARRVIDAAAQSAIGDSRLIVLHATRFFHEAQNALLKVFEEPPEGVVIILGVPTAGILLPTLRSRLTALPGGRSAPLSDPASLAAGFLAMGKQEREKYAAKLVERTRSDKQETKDQARAEAQELMAGLTALAYSRLHETASDRDRDELRQFAEDLSAFAPIMHERATPLKLIFEHLLLVIPKALS